MAGYVKRIALIKTLKSGYSADGGQLKGLVRCEAYAGFFKVEASLLNFAPLTDGIFRTGITDGKSVVVFDAPSYEGECDFDPTRGFACLIAHCNSGTVLPVACAVSGDNGGWLAMVEGAIERDEGGKKTAYDDEAIADENYYELEADENGRPVREDEEGTERSCPCKDENDARPGEEDKACGAEAGEGGIKCPTSAFRIGGTPSQGDDSAAEDCRSSEEGGRPADNPVEGEPARPELARGGFFGRMSEDIKKIFSTYPRAEALEDVIEGSRWAKISYGNGAHYAFGVIYDGVNAKYLCYAVPVESGAPCPPSLAGRAGYVPVDGGGYWVMYQDADTGVSLRVGSV